MRDERAGLCPAPVGTVRKKFTCDRERICVIAVRGKNNLVHVPFVSLARSHGRTGHLYDQRNHNNQRPGGK